MNKFMSKVIGNVVLSVQMLGLLIVGIIFILAPDQAVGLGLRYMKLKSAFSG